MWGAHDCLVLTLEISVRQPSEGGWRRAQGLLAPHRGFLLILIAIASSRCVTVHARCHRRLGGVVRLALTVFSMNDVTARPGCVAAGFAVSAR